MKESYQQPETTILLLAMGSSCLNQGSGQNLVTEEEQDPW